MNLPPRASTISRAVDPVVHQVAGDEVGLPGVDIAIVGVIGNIAAGELGDQPGDRLEDLAGPRAVGTVRPQLLADLGFLAGRIEGQILSALVLDLVDAIVEHDELGPAALDIELHQEVQALMGVVAGFGEIEGAQPGRLLEIGGDGAVVRHTGAPGRRAAEHPDLGVRHRVGHRAVAAIAVLVDMDGLAVELLPAPDDEVVIERCVARRTR